MKNYFFFLILMSLPFYLLSQSLPPSPEPATQTNELLTQLAHHIQEQDLEEVETVSTSLLTHIKATQERGNDCSDLIIQLQNRKLSAQKQKEFLEVKFTAAKWMIRTIAGAFIVSGIVSKDGFTSLLGVPLMAIPYLFPYDEITEAEQIIQCTDMLLKQITENNKKKDS